MCVYFPSTSPDHNWDTNNFWFWGGICGNGTVFVITKAGCDFSRSNNNQYNSMKGTSFCGNCLIYWGTSQSPKYPPAEFQSLWDDFQKNTTNRVNLNRCVPRSVPSLVGINTIKINLKLILFTDLNKIFFLNCWKSREAQFFHGRSNNTVKRDLCFHSSTSFSPTTFQVYFATSMPKTSIRVCNA